ncbi:hypothetical protein AVEN_195167-1 [Araneus ventricosus]|uniref:Uncharacterized protein n=1 Tax=Araneus ventricosus TaxID=182803 RepID=A0A4Y2T694_ARAVE|nr:hypothetical protein AVEN_195167-1 [Araneus ventricosus]
MSAHGPRVRPLSGFLIGIYSGLPAVPYVDSSMGRVSEPVAFRLRHSKRFGPRYQQPRSAEGLRLPRVVPNSGADCLSFNTDTPSLLPLGFDGPQPTSLCANELP